LLKLVKSAVASANQKGGVDIDTLVVKELLVDKGPTMRRWMPRARGMATPILKRTSHVKLVLSEK
jgi:large subunit ribosomal protein L22